MRHALLILCLLAPRELSAAPAYAHDPFIAREGAYYYLFSTGAGIPVSRSRDLHEWQDLAPVFPSVPSWLRGLKGFVGGYWAPEVSYHGGQWYLYYAASTFGRNESRIGLATTSTLDPGAAGFGWVDRGEVIASHPGDDWNAIDPSLAVDGAGRWYLTFGSFWTGIKQVELDPSTGKPAAAPPVLRSLARRAPDVPDDPIEAPFLSEHDGFWYLWVSIDYCCQRTLSTYKVAVGRSRDVTGPFVDEQGRDMRDGGGTVVLQSYGDVHGPGACSVLRDGERDLLVHHMYDGARGGLSVLQVRPIRWENGWPTIGDPL
jgi:arabinan endo-1,5-alpha-L-arabinosidase